MKYLFLAMLFSHSLFADDFSELKKKQNETIAKDPFANNKSACSATTFRGIKLSESWSFYKTNDKNTFVKLLSPAVQKGTYLYEDNKLKIKQTTSVIGTKETEEIREFEYPVKITDTGYEYILTNRMNEKILYTCNWMGSSLK